MVLRVFLLGFAILNLVTHGAMPAAANSTIGNMDCMVTSIISGDDITVNSEGTQINVQLYGLEAPVMSQSDPTHSWHRKPGQPYAREAFISLANKILFHQVKLEIVHIVSSPQPPYLHAIATVWLGGRNINLEMLAEGMGWATRAFPNEPYAAEYAHAQGRARSRKLGLWSQSNPLPPWEFRKMGTAKFTIRNDGKTP